MNIIITYKKSIVFTASILTFNAVTVPAFATQSNDSIESSINKTKVSSLHFSKTKKDNSHLTKAGNKGACNVNPNICK